MERRRLLYCELSYDNASQDDVQQRIRTAVQTMDTFGALEHFREKPDKPYFVWWGEQRYGLASFNLRLKTTWDIETVFYHLNEIERAHVTGLSWFPSRESYGGTVQTDGSVIETWDI
jgi:hypothetical protein